MNPWAQDTNAHDNYRINMKVIIVFKSLLYKSYVSTYGVIEAEFWALQF